MPFHSLQIGCVTLVGLIVIAFGCNDGKRSTSEMHIAAYLQRKHDFPFSMVDAGHRSFEELKIYIISQLKVARDAPIVSNYPIHMIFSAFEELLHYPRKRVEAAELAVQGIRIGMQRDDYHLIVGLLDFLEANRFCDGVIEQLLKRLCLKYGEIAFRELTYISAAQAQGWSLSVSTGQSQGILLEAGLTMRHFGRMPPIDELRAIGVRLVDEKMKYVRKTEVETYPPKFRHLAREKFLKPIPASVRELEFTISSLSTPISPATKNSRPRRSRSISTQQGARSYRHILLELKKCSRAQTKRIESLLDELSLCHNLPIRARRYLEQARCLYRLKLRGNMANNPAHVAA